MGIWDWGLGRKSLPAERNRYVASRRGRDRKRLCQGFRVKLGAVVGEAKPGDWLRHQPG